MVRVSKIRYLVSIQSTVENTDFIQFAAEVFGALLPLSLCPLPTAPADLHQPRRGNVKKKFLSRLTQLCDGLWLCCPNEFEPAPGHGA